MDSVDSATLNGMLNELRNITGAVGKLGHLQSSHESYLKSKAQKARNNSDPYGSSETAWKKMGNTVSNVSKSFGVLVNDTNHLSSSIKNITITWGILGTAIGSSIDYLSSLTGTWRKLSDVGFGFGDSLIGMTKKAAAGGVTLEEYSRLMQRSSVAAAMLGKGENGTLNLLAKAVRNNTNQFGLFGYSIEEMNDLVGDYMDTMRHYGRATQLDQNTASKSIVDLAKNTTALSSVFGRSRNEIHKSTQEILKSTLYASRMASSSASEQMRGHKIFSTAIAGIQAQFGEAGSVLSQFLANTVGMGGRAELTGDIEQFAKAGAPEIVAMMQGFHDNLASLDINDPKHMEKTIDAQLNFTDNVMKLIDQKRGDLEIQARMGNKEADMLLKLSQQKSSKGRETLKAEMKREYELAATRDKFTSVVASFTNVWNEFVGDVKVGVFSIIEPMLTSLGDILGDPQIKDALHNLKQTLGVAAGAIVNSVIRFFGGDKSGGLEKTINTITEKIIGFTAWLDAFLNGNKTIDFWGSVGAVMKDGLSAVWDSIKAGLSGALISFTDMIMEKLRAPLDDTAGVIVKVIAAFMAMKMLFKAFSLPGMNVSANIVNVTRGAGGPFGGGDIGGDSKKKGPKSRRWGRGVRGGAGGLASAAGNLGGAALKRLPLIGNLITAGSAAVDYAEIMDKEKKGDLSKEDADKKKTEVIATNVGAMIGLSMGAKLGAGVGAMFGGVGAVPGMLIGGALGAGIGGVAGMWASSSSPAKPGTDGIPKPGTPAVPRPTTSSSTEADKELQKRQSELRVQREERGVELNQMMLAEMKKLQNIVQQQTEISVAQQKEQIDALKESNRRLQNIEDAQ